MAPEFGEQGGVATMDPNSLVRWLTSRISRWLATPERLLRRRKRFEKARAATGARHVVEYFHQIDDAYSHLAAQLLAPLRERYDIDLVCHLVDAPSDGNTPEPELLLGLARRDASAIASHYGLRFADRAAPPKADHIAAALALLSARTGADFVDQAVQIGGAFWAGDDGALSALVESLGAASESAVRQRLVAGNARRSELGHYSGAMFYCAGEWYWGVDRLYHLEQRLAELGIDRQPDAQPLAARPSGKIPAQTPVLHDNQTLTLEIYASLRSPYTAIFFDPVVDLARRTGVRLLVRPVLPMVMRGVPLTREKGLYIFTDVAREARAANIDFGRFYDPIGEPIRRCYALYPWACEQGKGTALLSSFLRAAFTLGINTNRDAGMQMVVETAGLDWRVAKTLFGCSAWQDELEHNRRAMYDAGLWGVPSLRLLNRRGEQVLATWGQDRLWLLEIEIQRQLAHRSD